MTSGGRDASGSWWRRLSPLPAVLIAAGGVGEAVANLRYPFPVLQSLVQAVAPAGVLVAAIILYQLVIRWNRVVLGSADPGDWLNGLGGVLVGASIGNAVAGGTWSSWSSRQPSAFVAGQLGMLAIGGCLVLIGACISVAMLAQLWQDLRFWLILSASFCLTLSSFLVLLIPDRTAWWALGCFAAAGMVMVCRALPDVPSRPVPASLQATSSGSLIVMAIAVAMLIASPFLGSHQLVVTFYAGLAIPCVGARLVSMVRDLEILGRAREQALTDDLTGIANRRSLIADLQGYLDRAEPVTVVLLDLDDFKLVNDRFGHGVGDDVLRAMTRIFLDQLPRRAKLARLGGDEFAVLLPALPERHAHSLGNRLVEASVARPGPGVRPLRIRASVGIARSGTTDSATEVMRRADIAMYQAKTSGAGVAFYDEDLDAQARRQLELVEDLREVFDSRAPSSLDQIQVYFQPQMDTAHGVACGAEALVRWDHPELGLLTPDRFLDLAEREGLMLALTARVLRVATDQWHQLNTTTTPVRISVNLSASCLGQPELLTLLDEVIESGVNPEAFVLEITETSVMTDPERATETITAAVSRGFEISLDDYGTGYSSLAYLNDLPAAELKIDRSFVGRLLTDDRTAAIVAATVELAHRLGMRLVAEGVEDEATMTLVRNLGCDQTQGYLHAKPMPASELHAWVAARQSCVLATG